MEQLTQHPVSNAQVQALLKEMVRSAMVRMTESLEAPVPATAGVDRLAVIETQLADIRSAMRARNWGAADPVAAPTAASLGISLDARHQPSLARQILSTQLRLLELEAQVEQTCDDPLHLGQDLLDQHGLAPRREGLQAPVKLSEAIEKAAENAPEDVEKKIRTIGKLALDHFGDIAMTMLTYGSTIGFFEAVWWMPKTWGRSHGKNRYNSVGKGIAPSEERRLADEKDARIIAEILADTSLTRADQRRKLAEQLTPRLVDVYVVVLRDMFQRIVGAALGRRTVGRDLDDDDRVVPSHKQLKAAMVKWHKSAKTPCGLPARVVKPKRRRSWSLEHVARLLTSPLYQGSTPKQRGRRPKGKRGVIIRDALYWVPLLMLHTGARPEEI
ncbi:MAG: hypothetical protein KGH84_09475 [Paracoccaceae bacterium]|nr:hypothetical protein [Paracoccaceae bacterium]